MLNDNHYNSRLQELEDGTSAEIGFNTEIRNRPVKDSEGSEAGIVDGLLYDSTSGKVRYAIIRLSYPGATGRRILAPIGSIEPYESGNIRISELSSSFVACLPDYVQGQVNPGVENMVRMIYSGETSPESTGQLTGHPESIGENFYSNRLFSLERLKSLFSSSGPEKLVKGVFDDTMEAETALTELFAAGFNTEDVELSSTAADEPQLQDEIETPQIANGGSVVSIRISNSSQALKASEILNRNGSVSVFEQGSE